MHPHIEVSAQWPCDILPSLHPLAPWSSKYSPDYCRLPPSWDAARSRGESYSPLDQIGPSDAKSRPGDAVHRGGLVLWPELVDSISPPRPDDQPYGAVILIRNFSE